MQYVAPVIKKLREISPGDRISGALNLKPAPYLPVKKVIDAGMGISLPVVIEAGTVVSLDQYGYVVPANGGTAADITYTALDVQYKVKDIESFTNSKSDPAVSAAKTVTGAIPANKPIGIVPYDVFLWDMNQNPWNQHQPVIALLNDYLVMVPLTSDIASNTYNPGDLVIPNVDGKLVPLASQTPVDVASLQALLDQVVGRVVKVVDVTADPNFIGGLDKVLTPTGSGLPGSDYPYPEGIDPDTKKGLVIQLAL